MAEIFPNEGLDWLLGIVPRGGTAPSQLWLGLFTSQDEETVPGSTAVLATQSGVTEASHAGYARRSIAAGAWAAASGKSAWGQDGRGTSTPEVSFDPAAGTGAAVNGSFIATAATGGIAVFYANFDDEEAEDIVVGKIIRVTPTLMFTP